MEIFLTAFPQFQMWAVFALIVVAFAVYIFERATMELTSLAIISFLLVFFSVFPVVDAAGNSILGPGRILEGFSNPALIAVLALLVMGSGIVRAGVLDHIAGVILGAGGAKGGFMLSLSIALVVPLGVSAFLNNIPVVVIFIPIMQAIAARYGVPASKLLIPLSYAAVLGGMTTLIGSSTNLLVNGALTESGAESLEFFDFTVPGLVMAASGLLYVLLVAPRILPVRSGPIDANSEECGKQYIAQMTIGAASKLIGNRAVGGMLPGLPDKTLRMVERGDRAILPPFEGYGVEVGDVLLVAATRKALTNTLRAVPESLHPEIENSNNVEIEEPQNGRWQIGEQVVAEVMVAPNSGLIGFSLQQIGFRYKTHCIVLGIQRRSRMLRSKMVDVPLEAGDVLLVQGQPDDISRLKSFRDVILLEWSAEDLPAAKGANSAAIIFLGVVATAASGLVPIVVSAMCGAIFMVVTGVLSIRHAFQAVDSKIVTTIAAALALGIAMKETEGAAYLALQLSNALEGASATLMLSYFFLLVAVLANIISTKTCAVLFTPIAFDLAAQVGVSHEPFIVAVIFAANCSFASPLGYQTNLLVMGPGHYRFIDYSRVGLPLVLLLWVVFSLFAPWYYGL